MTDFMNLALAQAESSLASGEVPVGCVFVLDSEVIAKSGNLTNKSKNATTHCEINCIREIERAGLSAKGCTVYVSVEPCIMCAHALKLAGVEKVFFGCGNEKFGGNGGLVQVNKGAYDSEEGLCSQQAVDVLQRFYEHGNETIPEKKRHRKGKIKEKEEIEDAKEEVSG